jgi:rare lipoprotein A
MTPPPRPSSASASNLPASNAPLPPPRPFDLGTIPGAGVPIAALRPHQATLAALR